MLMRCRTQKSTSVYDPSAATVNPPFRSQSAINLSQEYTEAVRNNPYKDLWKFHIHPNTHTSNQASDRFQEASVVEAVVVSPTHDAQLLSPNKTSVDEALSRVKSSNLTRLASACFDNSEHTYKICRLLQNTIDDARSLYESLHKLLETLPREFDSEPSLTQLQCDLAYDVFLQFDGLENPFPFPGSDNFLNTRRCFSELKLQLDKQVQKSRKRTQLILRRDLNRIAQLEAAARGTYVLNHDLNTIDRLVSRLYDAVESDKFLVRFGLQRGRDSFPIQVIIKQLRKSQPNFQHQLQDLEEHVCLCFGNVNRARSLLLQEIRHHQAPKPRRSRTI